MRLPKLNSNPFVPKFDSNGRLVVHYDAKPKRYGRQDEAFRPGAAGDADELQPRCAA